MTEPARDPHSTPIGTAARPAFTRRPALFVGLLILFLIWMGALIAMSIQLHRR